MSEHPLTPHADLVLWLRFHPERMEELGRELTDGGFECEDAWEAVSSSPACVGGAALWSGRPGSVRFTAAGLRTAIVEVLSYGCREVPTLYRAGYNRGFDDGADSERGCGRRDVGAAYADWLRFGDDGE